MLIFYRTVFEGFDQLVIDYSKSVGKFLVADKNTIGSIFEQNATLPSTMFIKSSIPDDEFFMNNVNRLFRRHLNVSIDACTIGMILPDEMIRVTRVLFLF